MAHKTTGGGMVW